MGLTALPDLPAVRTLYASGCTGLTARGPYVHRYDVGIRRPWGLSGVGRHNVPRLSGQIPEGLKTVP